MKSKGYIFIGMGVILLTVALSLFLYNNRLEKDAEATVNKVVPSLQKVVENNQKRNIEKPKDNAINGDVVKTDGYIYAGILAIPSLGLELPVLASYSYKDLKKAPCIYEGNPSGHMVIAAHNYKCHFGRLSKINIGDTVRYTTVLGEVFEYKVEVIEELGAKDNDRLVKADWDLSLFTCNYMGDKRVTVRCNKCIS